MEDARALARVGGRAPLRGNYSWTQPCCPPCRDAVSPRGVTQTRRGRELAETCVFCGDQTWAGVYCRIDPAVAAYPTLERR